MSVDHRGREIHITSVDSIKNSINISGNCRTFLMLFHFTYYDGTPSRVIQFFSKQTSIFCRKFWISCKLIFRKYVPYFTSSSIINIYNINYHIIHNYGIKYRCLEHITIAKIDKQLCNRFKYSTSINWNILFF